jgi:hypothetical protein
MIEESSQKAQASWLNYRRIVNKLENVKKRLRPTRSVEPMVYLIKANEIGEITLGFT